MLTWAAVGATQRLAWKEAAGGARAGGGRGPPGGRDTVAAAHPPSLPSSPRYYRDRLNVPRGPATLPVLREAWIHGVIDEHTLIWGHGLMDWLPARNVRTLVPQIRTVEVAVATWVKKQLVLKPALAAARRARAEHRPEAAGEQVKRMY